MKINTPLPSYFVDGTNAATGAPVIGIETKGFFIHDPYLSSCGRFSVNPTEEYGISETDAELLKGINGALAEATEAALNAACKTIQDKLGVQTGDVAGMFFSDDKYPHVLGGWIREYIRTEYAMNAKEPLPRDSRGNLRPMGS